MQVLDSCDADEVVLLWLQGELSSPRFAKDLSAALNRHHGDESLIKTPNLKNKEENKRRLQVLREYRPWFKDDPEKLEWHYVNLNINDIRKLHYIDYSYWNELSDNTHLVEVAANNVRAGKVVFDVSNEAFWQVAQLIDESQKLPAIIIRSVDTDGPYEILEGHVRATAYALANNLPESVRAVMGLSNGS